MTRTNCVYCGAEITTPSREHVIQNALGGMYESTDICCPKCNNYVSKYIDVPFTKIFNPIISRIDNLAKTNATAGASYSGTVEYNGKQYTAFFKGHKLVSCPELARELKCDVCKLNLEPKSFNFDLNNDAFKTGFSKIAFNYALDYGIDLNVLKHGLKVTSDKGTIKNISFNYPMIPFIPLNPIDAHIELNTDMELYHNMILFSQENTLWCYIDLFNTFQYYVLLSDNFDRCEHVYNNYAQYLTKVDTSLADRITADMETMRPKDILMYAQQYKVQPTMDIDVMRTRLKNAINSQSRKQPLEKVISKKIQSFSPFVALQSLTTDHLMYLYTTIHLYMNGEDDKLITENFRTLTPTPDGRVAPYTWLLNELIKRKALNPEDYTTEKFNRLNKYLANQKSK